MGALQVALLASVLLVFADSQSHSCDENPFHNGCTIPFDLDIPFQNSFLPACKRHDICYMCDLTNDGYGGPAKVASEIAGLYPENAERGNVHILDVAAGTGLVGEELAKQGFVKVDALDPSQGMLDKAKAKGVYQNLICSYFDEKELDIAPDTYDAIVICGGCTNMHLPCDCLREVVRLVKPGGYFAMVTRPFHLNTVDEYNNGRFEALMDEIEKEGKWKNIRKEIFPGYHRDYEGISFVYQIK